MKAHHWIMLGLVLYVADRYNRSHSGMSAIDTATQAELSNFTAMQGTNFTNSLWDPVSGQPAYQFGTIQAPGGAAVMGTQSFTVF